MSLGLSGCGNAFDMGPREITLEYPPNGAETAQASADAQCKPYGAHATLKGTETHGNVTSAVFSCS
jgi:hypothetical protein